MCEAHPPRTAFTPSAMGTEQQKKIFDTRLSWMESFFRFFFFFLPFWALRCYMRLWPDIALPGDPLLVKKADRGALVVAQW